MNVYQPGHRKSGHHPVSGAFRQHGLRRGVISSRSMKAATLRTRGTSGQRHITRNVAQSWALSRRMLYGLLADYALMRPVLL
jgi:hypothetical protein